MIENPHLLFSDVRAFLNLVQKKGHCFDILDLPKCSVRAEDLRRDGNRLYVKKDYKHALEKYNESICSATNDSEDLGIGYANRSAVFYDQADYVLALANIALAKRHNYPERLMPKLMARETNCHEKLEENNITATAQRYPTLVFNTEANPRIPFLSKGTSARQLPIYGNSLVAERDFKAGDVILHEKPMNTSVSAVGKFIHCNHCLSGNLLHLIPCPNCASAMFCNEECLQEGFKKHRFECGVTAKLASLNDFWLGPRMFFHGLTLFDDDVQKMMAFCQASKEFGNSFFDLDYSNRDPLEEFKASIGITFRTIPEHDFLLQFSSAVFYTMYMEVPLVQSLITSEAQKDFMLKCFYDYMFLMGGMVIYLPPIIDRNGQIYPIGSICNHSCDPNTLALDYGGQLKLVVLRPIRRGEQIFVSYVPLYGQPFFVPGNKLQALGFKCACDVCDDRKRPKWLAKLKKKNPIALAHWVTIHRVIGDADLTDADRLNALQQFVQRYAAFHPQQDFAYILNVYRSALATFYQLEMEASMRKKITV